MNNSPLTEVLLLMMALSNPRSTFLEETNMVSSQNDWLSPNKMYFLNYTSALVPDLTQKRHLSSSIGEECFAKSYEFIKLKKPVVQGKSKGKHKVLEMKGKLKESGTKSKHISQVAAVKPKVGIVKNKVPPPLTSENYYYVVRGFSEAATPFFTTCTIFATCYLGLPLVYSFFPLSLIFLL